ncbi:MAG: NMP kinase [Euryarchaeota archaeon]|nr:NMP kinase [Euryarchaeota archaeon]OUW22251.1 MAG: hypothetical protein CBD33_03180 [Euryarchaeota archaeon TMED173]
MHCPNPTNIFAHVLCESCFLGQCCAISRRILVNIRFGGLVKERIRVGLTGSPGVGKTTVSSLLVECGFSVESVEMIAEKYECIEDVDPKDGARAVDIEELASYLDSEWSDRPKSKLVIDGHLSHFLPVDCLIVLRCAPEILKQRLSSRGYSDSKISENVDWEIIGSAWNEVNDEIPLIEFDSSSQSSESVAKSILNWIEDGCKPNRPLNPIDWISKGEG